MVASASDSVRNVGNLQALREVKQAEEEVREMRAEAEEEAKATIQEAKTKARSLIEEKKREAEAEAESILEAAEEDAEEDAHEIIRQAEKEAAELRDVDEEILADAAQTVVDRFRSELGGA